jgi:chorismate mutase/prephenate dehydratase
MPVVHNLLGVKGAKLSDLSTVYSHGQALSQCEEFIKEKGLTPIEYSNTAGAAKMVAEKRNKSIAAIGSAFCGKQNGLELLVENIQSFKGNKTRFIIISKTPILTRGREKISLVFSLPHTPGSLQKILTRFSLHGLNLTKLESRAGRHGDFETCFYLDFLGDVEHEKTKSLLLDLKEDLPDFAFLGNYKEIIL